MSAAVQKQMRETHLHVRGEMLTPLPVGALWWSAQRTLIVSDLHFEKGSSFAAAGQLIPPYDTSATLAEIESLVEAYQPERIISLGDSFHDGEGSVRLPEPYRDHLKSMMN